MIKSMFNIYIPEVLWRRIIRFNKNCSYITTNYVRFKVDYLGEFWMDYDYSKNIAKIRLLSRTDTSKKEEIKDYVKNMVNSTKLEKNIASMEAQRFEVLHANLLKIKSNNLKFQKEFEETKNLQEDINFVLNRYESDPRAQSDFLDFMSKFIKILRKISSSKVKKLQSSLVKEIIELNKWNKKNYKVGKFN